MPESASNLVECQICHVYYKLKGIGPHRAACAREHNSRIQEREFLKKKKEKESKTPIGINSLFSWICAQLIYTILTATIVGSSNSRLVVKPWEKYGRLGYSNLHFSFLKFYN